jgi:hypothetical protein
MATDGHDRQDRRAAMLRGLGFLERYALSDACWRLHAPDVTYLFFHLATRPDDRVVARRARTSALRVARRWCRENPRLPGGTSPGDALWWYGYGACAPTALGLDTRALRRDLARAARAHEPADFVCFDPRRGPPPHDHHEPCGCGALAKAARCPECGDAIERLHRYQTWQAALVGAHIAETLGVDIGCTVRDAARWRASMQPYPDLTRRVSDAGWHAFYAVTHLVYALCDYSLHRLSPGPLAAEIALVRQACRRATTDGDVEMMGESIDVLLAVGEDEQAEPIVRARQRLLAAQKRDGSWGDEDDEPYTRMHKTWVALDGLTSYRDRRLVRPRLPRPRS